MLRGCFVVSNIEKGGRGGYHSRGGREEFTPRKKVDNFHVSQQLFSMIVGGYSEINVLYLHIIHIVNWPVFRTQFNCNDTYLKPIFHTL